LNCGDDVTRFAAASIGWREGAGSDGTRLVVLAVALFHAVLEVNATAI